MEVETTGAIGEFERDEFEDATECNECIIVDNVGDDDSESFLELHLPIDLFTDTGNEVDVVNSVNIPMHDENAVDEIDEIDCLEGSSSTPSTAEIADSNVNNMEDDLDENEGVQYIQQYEGVT